MPENVRITDVAPRDGLQNEPDPIPTERKADLVRTLAASGVDEVEVTSFVSPKWVPQLGDAKELCAMLDAKLDADKPEGVVYSALVPNDRGLESLLAVNSNRLLDKASVFTAASETFSQKNTNASIAETIERFRPVAKTCHAEGLKLRAYVSCIVACPFEGPIEPEAVARVVRSLLELEPDEIDLGDTIGAATPETIGAIIEAVRPHAAGRTELVLHLHDTTGTAAACAREALRHGIRSFDASAGGLGGCPYASTPERRAPGNIATRALLDAIEAEGFAHGVDRAKLAAADRIAAEVTA